MKPAGKLWIALATAMGAVACGHAPNSQPNAPAPAAPISPRPDAPIRTVVCLLEGDERKLELFVRDGGCFVRYTRRGNKREAASSQNGTEHCRKIMDRIEGHLTAGGFQCGS